MLIYTHAILHTCMKSHIHICNHKHTCNPTHTLVCTPVLLQTQSQEPQQKSPGKPDLHAEHVTCEVSPAVGGGYNCSPAHTLECPKHPNYPGPDALCSSQRDEFSPELSPVTVGPPLYTIFSLYTQCTQLSRGWLHP